MSESFEFWDEQLNKEYDKGSRLIQRAFEITASSFDMGVVVLGKPFTGKSELITHIIETQIFIKKERMKKVQEIIKISYEDFIKIETLKKSKKSQIKKVSEFIELGSSISLGIAGVSIDIALEKKISRMISKKKINIIWIDNINKDFPLSLEQVSKIVEENKGKKNIYFMSSSDPLISTRLLCKLSSTLDLEEVCIPNIDEAWYIKKSANPIDKYNKAYPNSLFNKIKKSGHASELIRMSEGSYGFLKLLVNEKNSFHYSEYENTNILQPLFLNKINDEETKNTIKLNLLLQSLLSSEEGLYVNWLEYLFPDFSFDYFKYIDNWEERGLINRGNNKKNYQINPFFTKYREEYLKKFENKSLSRNLSKKIDSFLKQDSPEKYNLRYVNAQNFDENLSQEYIFIHLLRNKTNLLEVGNIYVMDESFDDSKKNLLRLLKTSTKKLNDTERDKILKELRNSKTEYLPLLIYSEYAYFRLQVLLDYSYNEKNKVRNIVELQIHRLIRTFDDLVEQGEDDMAIKIGLLLSSQIMNYLSKKEHSEAYRIYKWVAERIYKRKKLNYQYYKRYDIIGKFISTSILPYKVASYKLHSILESLTTDNYNDTELLPVIFGNLLGITLFLDYQSIEELQIFYNTHVKLLSYSNTTDYKLHNNLLLSKACLNDEKMSEKENEYLTEFKKIKNKHVSAINYAGFLFYSNQISKARAILEQIITKEKYDDFYQFYCKYNLCLIDLLTDLNKNRSSILNTLEYLEIPSLFYNKEIEIILKKRIGILKKIVNQASNSLRKPMDIDTIFLKYTNTKIPLFKFSWNFSDYQHWN